MDDAVWPPTTFTKNRDRLLDGDVAAAFFDAVLIHADAARLLSDEHFTVHGTRSPCLRHPRFCGRAPYDARHAACCPIRRDPHRRSAIDGRTTRQPGYAISQQKRKLVEHRFGWMKRSGSSASCDTAADPSCSGSSLHRRGLEHRADASALGATACQPGGSPVDARCLGVSTS